MVEANLLYEEYRTARVAYEDAQSALNLLLEKDSLGDTTWPSFQELQRERDLACRRFQRVEERYYESRNSSRERPSAPG